MTRFLNWLRRDQPTTYSKCLAVHIVNATRIKSALK